MDHGLVHLVYLGVLSLSVAALMYWVVWGRAHRDIALYAVPCAGVVANLALACAAHLLGLTSEKSHAVWLGVVALQVFFTMLGIVLVVFLERTVLVGRWTKQHQRQS
jgi:hypothetical protein